MKDFREQKIIGGNPTRKMTPEEYSKGLTRRELEIIKMLDDNEAYVENETDGKGKIIAFRVFSIKDKTLLGFIDKTRIDKMNESSRLNNKI